MRDYAKLQKDINKALGIDLTAYKEQQMRRRINQWLDRHQIPSYDHLISTLAKDREHKEKVSRVFDNQYVKFFSG